MITSGRSAAAGRPAPGSSRVRVRAVIDVAVIVAITLGALWLASRIPGWRGWEQRVFGGQWLVQGPITIEAAKTMGINRTTSAMMVAWGDQWTNMIQPFWALPLLAIAGLKVRDILAYTTVTLVASGLVFAATLLIVGAG